MRPDDHSADPHHGRRLSEVIASIRCPQARLAAAVATELSRRPGELCALSWADLDQFDIPDKTGQEE
jgi:hypothetical protein